MLKEVPGFAKFDPLFLIFVDSSHADCDEAKSTGCDLHVFQGGLIDANSWVPDPVPQSTAESENNSYSASIMRGLYHKRTIMRIIHGDPDHPYTIPICVDNTAAITMNTSDKVTRRVRHVSSRYWFGRQAVKSSQVAFVKVDGKTQQPADIGTKNVQAAESRYYRWLFESNTPTT
jgi:hypothetical protein